ncbi:hypothetical protein MRB53_027101 [Persea americana]|uniref:Uncharacterized protein n=1 Tax=Persea americana TaxID=3435 RepID=A0ACC2LJY0_PERAE|nr:hypothetical protein MRB53_027101 [Persea americana]
METAVGEVQDHLLFPLAGRRPYPHQKEVSISTANETVKGDLAQLGHLVCPSNRTASEPSARAKRIRHLHS